MAVVASRKVGPAVVRNRVKRRFRELFRRNKALLSRAARPHRHNPARVGEAALDRAPGGLRVVAGNDLSQTDIIVKAVALALIRLPTR
ncbi:MAG: ribonuclease P protein component [Desulfomicrobium escambiense]|nr:ribonuclease P protein component [Desulfomicrobium escambiense]